MRRFYVVCYVDNILGDVVIAEGVVFDDKTIALRWKTSCRSTVVFDTYDAFIGDLRTRGSSATVQFIDPEPSR